MNYCMGDNKVTKEYYEKEIKKRDEIISILYRWLYLTQKNRSLEKYFIQKKYYKIAIYGAGMIGEMLSMSLKNSEVEVKYLIDIDAKNKYLPDKVIHPHEPMDEVDIIIITTVGDVAYEIKGELEKRIDVPILLMKDILKEV